MVHAVERLRPQAARPVGRQLEPDLMIDQLHFIPRFLQGGQSALLLIDQEARDLSSLKRPAHRPIRHLR
jgi:hypothetical protein